MNTNEYRRLCTNMLEILVCKEIPAIDSIKYKQNTSECVQEREYTFYLVRLTHCHVGDFSGAELYDYILLRLGFAFP